MPRPSTMASGAECESLVILVFYYLPVIPFVQLLTCFIQLGIYNRQRTLFGMERGPDRRVPMAQLPRKFVACSKFRLRFSGPWSSPWSRHTGWHLLSELPRMGTQRIWSLQLLHGHCAPIRHAGTRRLSLHN